MGIEDTLLQVSYEKETQNFINIKYYFILNYFKPIA